ncbi:hypothetical protein [Azorhizobium doebereinerae]|uniref:hypothetical protein n=1 Tax=Azorhizobium doebereinerae TaxID=281091 RepID=UPI0004912CCC|nr:hypothetical protein [Azorhizobium doebereinerae]
MSIDPRVVIIRPIIGIENRTPQEVFDIMVDRIAFNDDIFTRVENIVESPSLPAGMVSIITNGTTRIIPADEPVFLIRGQDALGAAVVRKRASLAARAGVAGDMVAAALEHADKMEAWPVKKVPDVPAATVGSAGMPADQGEYLPLKSMTSRDVRISRLQAAIEGELEGLVCGDREADVILTYVETGKHPDEVSGERVSAPPNLSGEVVFNLGSSKLRRHDFTRGTIVTASKPELAPSGTEKMRMRLEIEPNTILDAAHCELLEKENAGLREQIADLKADIDVVRQHLDPQGDHDDKGVVKLAEPPLRDLLHEIRRNGLIYWEPNTTRGRERKADMLARIDAALKAAGIPDGSEGGR